MSHQHRARPSHWRHVLGQLGGWTPAEPTSDGQRLPDHWLRSDQGLWQDAGLTPATADGDVVGRWEDISANADHVNQATASKKPTLQSGAGDLLNGYPVVRTDGIDDWLKGAFTTGGALTQPYTFFAVASLDASVIDDNVARTITGGDDAFNQAMLMKSTAPSPDKWSILGGLVLVGTAADSDWSLWTALFNGASSQFWHNGVGEAGPGNAGSQVPDGLTIGAHQAGGYPWYGDIAEIIIYDADLSDADKNQVGRYLAHRYGLGYTEI